MRRRSSTWRSELLAPLLLLLAGGARADLCLPPLFEGGERLLAMPAPTVFWLEPLLRQHQLCWQTMRYPERPRFVVLGSSAVLGFPYPARASFTSLINADFAARQVPARLFNLGFIGTYQLRDALVAEAARRYRPDVIVAPLTVSDFVHVAPNLYPPMERLMRSNRELVAAMTERMPPELRPAFEAYGPSIRRWRATAPAAERPAELGRLARAAAAQSARGLLQILLPEADPPSVRFPPAPYDCQQTLLSEARQMIDWQTWNVLAYLDQLRREDLVEVVVINWPMVLDRNGPCYNARVSVRLQSEFTAWMAAETARRGLPYVDLATFLAREDFVDTVHVNPDGHRKLAERLAPTFEAMAQEALFRRRQRSGDWRPGPPAP